MRKSKKRKNSKEKQYAKKKLKEKKNSEKRKVGKSQEADWMRNEDEGESELNESLLRRRRDVYKLRRSRECTWSAVNQIHCRKEIIYLKISTSRRIKSDLILNFK